MKNSKRPMSERHEPHDQNTTPHDGFSCGRQAISLWYLFNSPVSGKRFFCDPIDGGFEAVRRDFWTSPQEIPGTSF